MVRDAALSRKRIEAIIAMASFGAHLDDIASSVRLSRSYVQAVCKNNGIAATGIISIETRQRKQEAAVAEVKAGNKIEVVAEKYGFRPRYVWSLCQRNGVPTAGMWVSRKGHRSPSMNLDEFVIWAKKQCVVSENGKCLLWTGFVNKRGYGRARFNGSLEYVHRLVLEHKLGRKLGPKECALHACDTSSCINAECLWPGTNKDNVDDREAKGRNIVKRGEDSTCAKLTSIQVMEIRKELEVIYASARRKAKDGSIKGLAEKYNVSKDLIHRIKNRQLWKHLA